MNQHAAWLLFVPMMAFANELPPPKAQPIKAAASAAAPTVKPIKPVVASVASDASAKPVSKHAAPQQMAEPIKLVKPSTARSPVPAMTAEVQSTASEVLKPTGDAVSRYVSPQFSTAKAESHRPVVRSKAPTASKRSSSTKTSYAIKPGLVRVLPASQIPSNAIVPPSRQIQWSAPSNNAMPNTKANIAWGVIESEAQKTAPEVAKSIADVVAVPVVGRKIASPKYYSETNSELRWQYYSYP
nr:hypothetical protein [uncultured Deefgea sp.]